jgi:hypothetical protein
MGSKGEGTTEAKQLSQLVAGTSNTLVDLGMLPVQGIPQLLKSAWEVLMAAGLILEHLREAQPPAPIRGTELGPAAVSMASGCMPRRFSFPSFFCPSEQL